MNLNIIVAITKNKVIWKNWKLPWNIKQDLESFKEITTWWIVIMWYKTFKSIWKPLSNRENIILSKNKNIKIKWVKVFNSKIKVLEYLNNKTKKIFIIWWEEIYKLFLDNTSTIYLNLIHKNYIWDKYFPKFEQDFDIICKIKWPIFDKLILLRKW